MACYKRKTVNEVLDYEEDWSDVLNASTPADTIAVHTWTVASGMTKDSVSNTTTTSGVSVSGGTLGIFQQMTIKIVTNHPRTHERVIYVEIVPADKR